jgi:hypothetical protein
MANGKRQERMHSGGTEVTFRPEEGVDMTPVIGPFARYAKGQHVWLVTADGTVGHPLKVRTVLARGYYTLESLPNDPHDTGDWVGVHEDMIAPSELASEVESLGILRDRLSEQLAETREQYARAKQQLACQISTLALLSAARQSNRRDRARQAFRKGGRRRGGS